MAKTAYPTTADLQSFLEDTGIATADVTAQMLAEAALAGRQEFERETGRTMLGGAADTTLRYDPPTNGQVVVIEDLASLTRVDYQPQGATAETLTENEDYWLRPYNRAQLPFVEPATSIAFRRVWRSPLPGSVQRSILVVGRHGYGTAAAGFPDDAWLAMLARGAWKLGVNVTHRVTGGLLSWKHSDASEDYGVERWANLRAGWNEQYQAAVARYARVWL